MNYQVPHQDIYATNGIFLYIVRIFLSFGLKRPFSVRRATYRAFLIGGGNSALEHDGFTVLN